MTSRDGAAHAPDKPCLLVAINFRRPLYLLATANFDSVSWLVAHDTDRPARPQRLTSQSVRSRLSAHSRRRLQQNTKVPPDGPGRDIDAVKMPKIVIVQVVAT